MNSRKPIVFYDGGCGLCSREIDHYRRLDDRNRVEWIDITREPGRLKEFDLDWRTCMEVLHAVDGDGRLHTGTRAFALLWAQLPGYRWLARLVRLPGILFLLEPPYRRFARWHFRRRMACTSE